MGNNENINSKIIESTKWSGIMEMLSRLIAPTANIILARLLTPEVFGVVATFTLVVTFAEVFTDAGFQKYLVQHEFKNAQDREQSTDVAFWTNFIFSCVVWLVIFLFRDTIAIWVGSEGYGIQIAIMSLCIPLVALSSIQRALYRRDFRFKQLLPANVAASSTPLLVTVPLAFIFRNSWAMVCGSIAKEIIYIIILSIRSDWKPRFYYSFAKLKEMLSFSLHMMANSFLVWVTGYAGIFVVGRYLDNYYIGIYKTGIATITAYMNLIYLIMAPVLFSALSRIQDDKRKCNDVFFSIQHYCAMIELPLGFGVFMYRDFVTRILLGSQWGEASLILGCTGLSIAFVVLTAQFNSDYFRACGRPGLASVVQAIYAVVMFIILDITAKKSFVLLSVAQGGIGIFYSLVSIAVLCIVFHVSAVKVLKSLLIPLCASVIMSAVAWLLIRVSTGIAWTLLSVLICIVVYGIVLLLVPSTRHELLSLGVVRKMKGRLSRR